MHGTISFQLNGSQKTVVHPDPLASLYQWMRSQPKLTGTKIMCEEGGCGCCAIILKKNGRYIVANSCLLPLCSLHGYEVITIEGITTMNSYDKMQKHIAVFGASQCGFCTPGFIMTMQSLLSEVVNLTEKKIEDSFDGNLCRCTGYRSILDAMKSIGDNYKLCKNLASNDIEDIIMCPSRQKFKKYEAETNGCSMKNIFTEFDVIYGDKKWKRPASLKSLINHVHLLNGSVNILCGNTGSGIFKDLKRRFAFFVDISGIPELCQIDFDLNREKLYIGSSVTLENLKNFLEANLEASITFEPMKELLNKVASLPIRNIASWAGNLMLKHQQRSFQSDVFTMFVAAHAKLKIIDAFTNSEIYCQLSDDVDTFFTLDMSGKIIVGVEFPLFHNTVDEMHVMKAYKISARSQNSHAYVNAVMHATITTVDRLFLDIIVCYGGLSNSFFRALKTEKYLVGKTVNSKGTWLGAMEILQEEIYAEQFDNVDMLPNIKKRVSLSIFYKFYISMCDVTLIDPKIGSAAHPLECEISTSEHKFITDKEQYPVSQPIPKISSNIQVAGKAYYSSDRTRTIDELFAQYVTSNIANADIDNIDISDAMKMEGCVDIIYRGNFPSSVKNTYYYPSDPTQPIIAFDHVKFAGQPVALVIADSQLQAKLIAEAVKVTYKNQKRPILSIDDCIREKSFFPCNMDPIVIGDPEYAIMNADYQIEGEMNMQSQYHMYMETQFSHATTTDDGGFDIESGTQSQKKNQMAISHAFDIPCNKIKIHTKRIGGAFGGKGANSLLTAVGAALGAYVTKRPTRMHPGLRECMETYGMRSRYFVKYKVGVNKDGVIEGIDWIVYEDNGCSIAQTEITNKGLVMGSLDNTYHFKNLKFTPHICKTNLPSRTWMRCPGYINMIGMVETVMEHVAFYLKVDAIEIKYINLYKAGQYALLKEPITQNYIRDMFDKILVDADIRGRQREIKHFNSNNKWKKKGLAVTPMKYGIKTSWVKFSVIVTIYPQDGSVSISHGGIECGQGINIKTAQVAAKVLDIPLDLIHVETTSTLTSSNSSTTGGSVSSEVNCAAIEKCCEILKSRIEPIKQALKDDASWKDIMRKCDKEGVDLTAHAMVNPEHEGMHAYYTYGVTASEVELDVLTAEYRIRRVDILYDCGMSLNPVVDIGQIEGGFVMGLGFWLTEKLVYDKDTGRLLTNGTWDYKVPLSKDIPEVWNIKLTESKRGQTGFMRSKTAGEPPMCMSVSVFHALKNAINEARKELNQMQHIELDSPATTDAILRKINISAADLTL